MVRSAWSLKVESENEFPFNVASCVLHLLVRFSIGPGASCKQRGSTVSHNLVAKEGLAWGPGMFWHVLLVVRMFQLCVSFCLLIDGQDPLLIRCSVGHCMNR